MWRSRFDSELPNRGLQTDDYLGCSPLNFRSLGDEGDGLGQTKGLTFLRDHHFDFHDVACLASRRRDGRLRMGDVLFVRRGSELGAEVGWG